MVCTLFIAFFAQFMQFPVLDFGLVHSGSEPFIYTSPEILTYLKKIGLLREVARGLLKERVIYERFMKEILLSRT